MRPPRARFTVRALMIAVAVAAIGLGAYRLLRRRERHFVAAAGWHQQRAALASMNAQAAANLDAFVRARPASRGLDVEGRMARSLRAEADLWGRKAAFHSGMARKYERAARYPWLPVALDPLEPE